jgi:small subunit ribosomal protein S6
MPPEPTIYDLLLVLSVSGEEEERVKILADAASLITAAGGAVERRDDWGRRPLAFRIRHQGEGDYHLVQFSGPTPVLESLSHSLRINDDVLRFRIIKVLPGTPPPPDTPPPVIVTVAPGAPISAGVVSDADA